MPFIPLDRDTREPLTRQIYRQTRDLILSGALPSGAAMSSTRQTAKDLGVSRNIVMNAFDQLLAEGYLHTRVGAGTFVASDAAFTPNEVPDLSAIRPTGFRPLCADRVDFRSGLPELSRFPIGTWQRLSREVWDRLTPLDLSYSQPEGRTELRGEIARYIGAHRGVRCHPDQILVTAGTTQAVGIVTRLLLQKTFASCILEDPITSDIRRIIGGFGGRIVPVPVDGQGLDTRRLPANLRPRFIYVTPSHQFPIGGTMPIQRRIHLLEYARARGAFVVEDDYDSEFKYDSPPIASIQGLDPRRVVYIGTFSKTLCPSMRIGYVVLPPELVNSGREVKWFSDLHNASVDQIVLARFIHDGHFLRYVHALKKVYRARRRVLAESLESSFHGAVEVLGSSAGLHLCARFPGVRFTPELVELIDKAGARVYPVEEHAMRKGQWADTLIFGYGMLGTERIAEGIGILDRCLARACRGMRAARHTTRAFHDTRATQTRESRRRGGKKSAAHCIQDHEKKQLSR
jgi:GntR family transcriptional regulator/MocR family aminotransferase